MVFKYYSYFNFFHSTTVPISNFIHVFLYLILCKLLFINIVIRSWVSVLSYTFNDIGKDINKYTVLLMNVSKQPKVIVYSQM